MEGSLSSMLHFVPSVLRSALVKVLQIALAILGASSVSLLSGCTLVQLLLPPGRCYDAHAIQQLYDIARDTIQEEGWPRELLQAPFSKVMVKDASDLTNNPDFNCRGMVVVSMASMHQGFSFPVYYEYHGEKIERHDVGITKFQKKALRDILNGKQMVKPSPVVPDSLR